MRVHEERDRRPLMSNHAFFASRWGSPWRSHQLGCDASPANMRVTSVLSPCAISCRASTDPCTSA